MEKEKERGSYFQQLRIKRAGEGTDDPTRPSVLSRLGAQGGTMKGLLFGLAREHPEELLDYISLRCAPFAHPLNRVGMCEIDVCDFESAKLPLS